MRVRSIQWKPTPGMFASRHKMRAMLRLIQAGADTSKCNLSFDWWEVEWPAPRQKEEA